MTPELFCAFVVMTTLMCLTPGPAVLLVTSQAMARGAMAGWSTALGVLAGNTIYFALSALGLAAVLHTSAFAFAVLKWAGAAYLIFLGVTTICNARKAATAGAGKTAPVWERPFTQGLVKQLANPKSVLYFGALMPQFILPGQIQAWHFALLLATMHAIELPILAAYAWAGARGGAFLRGPGGIMWRERIAGGAQIAVGSMLATLRRTA